MAIKYMKNIRIYMIYIEYYEVFKISLTFILNSIKHTAKDRS